MAARVREVVWAESAQAALDEVIEYIARDSRQAARDFATWWQTQQQQ
jgi:plasmid stabilization system protein ParE